MQPYYIFHWKVLQSTMNECVWWGNLSRTGTLAEFESNIYYRRQKKRKHSISNGHISKSRGTLSLYVITILSSDSVIMLWYEYHFWMAVILSPHAHFHKCQWVVHSSQYILADLWRTPLHRALESFFQNLQKGCVCLMRLVQRSFITEGDSTILREGVCVFVD